MVLLSRISVCIQEQTTITMFIVLFLYLNDQISRTSLNRYSQSCVSRTEMNIREPLTSAFYVRPHIRCRAYAMAIPSVRLSVCQSHAYIVLKCPNIGPIIEKFFHQLQVHVTKGGFVNLTWALNTMGSDFRRIWGYDSETVIDRGIFTIEGRYLRKFKWRYLHNGSSDSDPLRHVSFQLVFSGYANRMTLLSVGPKSNKGGVGNMVFSRFIRQ